ncbi:MAG: KH domain-containing protein, partial [archaeon]|nr:KH domain-containing protein [archaeon]
MDDHSEFLLVPHERIGAIIGKGGATRRQIEKKTQTKIVVDSKEGEVEVIQKGEAVPHLKATRIVKAIARGFSPEKAFRLLDDGVGLELFDITDAVGRNKSTQTAKKGRVIGEKGKAREEIERDTGANVSVFGKTIGIIGS